MNRRTFLLNTAFATLGAANSECFGQAVLTSDETLKAKDATTAELVFETDGATHLIPLNYNGLSYELAQLSNPNFFVGSNEQLIALFRLLSPQGVLRLGGNSSESCWFKADADTTAPDFRPVEGPASENWMPRRQFMIEPVAVDHLAEFLKASGWQVIYGLNLGHSSPERAAREAEYVAQRMGDHLLYFQIGNEPDFYRMANNKTHPANWGFADYLNEWTQFADAIGERVPKANFGGPDVGSSSDWISKFTDGASKKLGSRLMAVSGHYYCMGPPDDPKVTTARLLQTNPNIAKRTKAIVDAAAKDNLVYRMTEGNSCYRGGKPGTSNAFASALWAGDYMLALASVGCAGVNLHGGSRAFLRASLGDHMPGELVSKEGSDTKGGYYTPIDGEVDVGFSARPIFYGMYLANQLAGTNSRAVSLKNLDGVNATAYAGQKNSQLHMAVFNKDEARDVTIAFRSPAEYKQSKVWRLTGPALDSTKGITLAGAEMSATSGWSPASVETLKSAPDGPILELPKSSAALVFLET